jgi:HAD superfamily hydrolase (TIGR01484 family)
MKLCVVALDYDGTIAHSGVMDPEVREAIGEVRGHGITVVIVTGRILSDLRALAGDLRSVDAVVAENGAVFAVPGSGHSTTFGPPPPARFFEELEKRGIEFARGDCIVDADAR